jgi:hypothetical protein
MQFVLEVAVLECVFLNCSQEFLWVKTKGSITLG